MSGFLRAAVVLLLFTDALSYSYAESRATPYARIDSNDEVEVRCSCYKSDILNLTVTYYNESSRKYEVADFEATRLENSFGALLFTVDEMVTQINSVGGDGNLAVRKMRNATYGHSANSTLYSVTLTNPVPDRKYTCKFVWASPYSNNYFYDYKAFFTVIGENAALPTSQLTQYSFGSYVQMWEVQGMGFTPKFSIKFNDGWVKFAASNYTLSTQNSLYNMIYFVETLEAVRRKYYEDDTVEVTMTVGNQSKSHSWDGEISGYSGQEWDFFVFIFGLIALAIIFPLVLIAAVVVACVRGKICRSCCYDTRYY
eukprot:sb/3467053/